MPSTVQGGLPGIALHVDHQRMHLNPSMPCRPELHTVGAPVGLDRVAQGLKRCQHVVLEGRVDVNVDVSMRPRLAAHERVDPQPPSSQNRQPTARTAASTPRI